MSSSPSKEFLTMSKVSKTATVAVTPYITVRGEFIRFVIFDGAQGAVVLHKDTEVIGSLVGYPMIEGPLRPIH